MKDRKNGYLKSNREHFEVIGADGVHVGTVDRLEGDRIKLTKTDDGHMDGKHHYISTSLVSEVHERTVRLSANADVALTFEEDK